jgi:hypothetical protein
MILKPKNIRELSLLILFVIMKIKKLLRYTPILLLFMAGCAQKQDSLSAFRTGKWIDLTYSFDEQSIYWPTNIPFTHDTVFEGMND